MGRTLRRPPDAARADRPGPTPRFGEVGAWSRPSVQCLGHSGDQQGRAIRAPRSVRRAVCDQGRKAELGPLAERSSRPILANRPARGGYSVGTIVAGRQPPRRPTSWPGRVRAGRGFQRNADARPARFAAHHGSARVVTQTVALSCPVLDLVSADDTRSRLQCARAVEHLMLFDNHSRDGEHDERRRHHHCHPLERTGDPPEASGSVAQLDEASWAHDRTAAPSAA